MDTLDHFNNIAEDDFKGVLSTSINNSFKSLTFTLSTVVKIFSFASKKCLVGPKLKEEERMTEDDPTLAKLAFNVRNYAKDLELYAKTMLDKLSQDVEYDQKIPAFAKAKIEDYLRERNDIMGDKLPPHRRSTDLVRNLNSMALLIEGFVEVKDIEEHFKSSQRERIENNKEVQTLSHINGKVKYKGNIVNNEYHGQGVLYHYNGILLHKGQFVHGEPDGDDCEIFYFNSNLKYKGSIVEGIYDGYGELFHDNGCLKYKGNFQDDKPHSPEAYIYHRNGNLEYYGKIDKGFFVEFGTLYHKNNNLEYEGYFLKGGPHSLQDEDTTIFYDNGQIKYKGACKHGYFEGRGILYNRKGVIEYKGVFKQGQPIDDLTTFNMKGALNNDIQELSLSEISVDANEKHQLPMHDGEDHIFYSSLPIVIPGPPIEKIPSIAKFQKPTSNIAMAKTTTTKDLKNPSKSPIRGGVSKPNENYNSVQNPNAKKDPKGLYNRSSTAVNSKKNSRRPSGIVEPVKKPVNLQKPSTKNLDVDKTEIKKATVPVKEAKPAHRRTQSGLETMLDSEKKRIEKKPSKTPEKKPVVANIKKGPVKELSVMEKLANDLKELELRKKFDPSFQEKELYFKDQTDCQIRERDFYQMYEIPEDSDPKRMPRINSKDLSPHKYRPDNHIDLERQSASVSPDKLRASPENPNHYIKFREYNYSKPKPPTPKRKPDIAPKKVVEPKNVANESKKAVKNHGENTDKKKLAAALANLVPDIDPKIKKQILDKVSKEEIAEHNKSPTLNGGESPLIKRIKQEARDAKAKDSKSKPVQKNFKRSDTSPTKLTNKLGKKEDFVRLEDLKVSDKKRQNKTGLRRSQTTKSKEKIPEKDSLLKLQNVEEDSPEKEQPKTPEKEEREASLERGSADKFTITDNVERTYSLGKYSNENSPDKLSLKEIDQYPIDYASTSVQGKLNALAGFFAKGKSKASKQQLLDTSKF